MADQVTVTNMPESGSRQYVAFKLWEQLRFTLPDEGDWKAQINQSLDLYSTCLQAANHGRKTQL
jgi:hypothetical protein